MKRVAAGFLIVLTLLLFVGPAVFSGGYESQDRDHILSPPDGTHWLGTDSVGRDNCVRFLHGGRLSLLLASASAALSCAVAAVFGSVGALTGRAGRAITSIVFDVMLSTPWHLLVFLVRAMMPLDAPPIGIAAATFAILGLVGWAHGARLVRDAVREMAGATWLRQARAAGSGPVHAWIRHIVPNLRPLLLTQFLLLLPVLLLSEATLGMLGLGIPEPLPSWGGSLEDLVRVGQVAERPWTLLPAVLLALTAICLRLLAEGDQAPARWKESERLFE